MYDFSDFGFQAPEPATSIMGPYIPEASDCMRCGMCVAGCPTYRINPIAEESPRSRIRTISKLINDQAISSDEQTHLLNCLQCRACETVCPSQMAYGTLFDLALSKIPRQYNLLAKLGFYLIEHKSWRKRLLPLIAAYLKSGLRKPLQASGLLKKMGLASAEASLTMPSLLAIAPYTPAKSAKKGTVGLFTGCLAEHFDRETLDASIKLLTFIGFDVVIPEQQNCCGAIHQHNGLSAPAEFKAANFSFFACYDVDTMLYTASGCGAMLTETNPEYAEKFQDICKFMLNHWPEDLALKPLNKTIAVHEPCSQRNILKNQQVVYDLLAKIPNLTIQPLAENHLCCGAGGTYLISHPEQAQALRSLKHAHMAVSDADLVVSSNYGCAAFLQTDAKLIKHPLVVLAEQIP